MISPTKGMNSDDRFKYWQYKVDEAVFKYDQEQSRDKKSKKLPLLKAKMDSVLSVMSAITGHA